MTDSLLHAIRTAIDEAQDNADATRDDAHIEAAYEACEHINRRVNDWENANPVPAHTLRAILNGGGSAADKVQALRVLVPETEIEQELADAKNMNLQLAYRLRELLGQVRRQADTIATLKADASDPRALPDGLELMRHKGYGTVITVKNERPSVEGWVNTYRVRDTYGPRLVRRGALPEDLTPITEEAGQ